jgi:hypothetical protein
MPLGRASWSYFGDSTRNVDVEVDVVALERLAGLVVEHDVPAAVFQIHRAAIEQAARKIIDREGPNFAEPVRVTAADL